MMRCRWGDVKKEVGGRRCFGWERTASQHSQGERFAQLQGSGVSVGSGVGESLVGS